MQLRSRFSRIVRKAVDPVLLPQGFARRGQVYRRSLGQLWWMFHVERSWWNTAEECNFSIGGGVFVPEVYNMIYYHLPPKDPMNADTGDCIIQYTPEHPLDTSWTIRVEDDAEAVDGAIIESIKAHIVEKIFPFYERFKGLDDVVAILSDLYQNPEKIPFFVHDITPSTCFIPLHLSILHWLQGDQERACEYLEKAFEWLDHEWWQNHLVGLKKKLSCE